MLLDEVEGTEGGCKGGSSMDKRMRKMGRGPQPGAVRE